MTASEEDGRGEAERAGEIVGAALVVEEADGEASGVFAAGWNLTGDIGIAQRDVPSVVIEKTVARQAAGFFIELLEMQIGAVAKRGQ